jgi:hypothetical protein
VATTGAATFPSTTTYPETTLYPGQGEFPLPWILYSTDDVATSIPTWADASADVLSADTSRGRGSERETVNAGSARIVLNNRARAYDTAAVAALRPMNRWWIREQFSGATRDVFKGYAQSYEMQYPSKLDAVTVVSCVDEFTRLAQHRLDTTTPPRDSYEDVVKYDNPAGYWPLGPSVNPIPAVVGEEMTWADASPSTDEGAIVGQEQVSDSNSGIFVTGTAWATTAPLQPGQSGDAGGLDELTAEIWFNRASASGVASTEIIAAGPSTTGPASTWYFGINTNEEMFFSVRNSSGTEHLVVSTTIATAFEWYHLVAVLDGSDVVLYVNGEDEDTTAWTGTVAEIAVGNTYGVNIGNQGTTIGGASRGFDELAFYRAALSSDRVMAHYQAGRERGFAAGDLAGARVAAVLDNVGSDTPRSLRPGSREMVGAYMRGQPALDELRRAEEAEPVDGVLFVAADGTITFLDDDHRSVSPWNTVQATFDDDGTDLPYHDLGFDYSESFLVNKWIVTRDRMSGALLESTKTDATSVSRYGTRSQSLTKVPVLSWGDQDDIATALLAKYKDPMTRVTSLELSTSVPAVTEAVFTLDIGSRIRVFRTPPGGGSRIDQTLFVQSVGVSMGAEPPWLIRLGVSPL